MTMTIANTILVEDEDIIFALLKFGWIHPNPENYIENAHNALREFREIEQEDASNLLVRAVRVASEIRAEARIYKDILTEISQMQLAPPDKDIVRQEYANQDLDASDINDIMMYRSGVYEAARKASKALKTIVVSTVPSPFGKVFHSFKSSLDVSKFTWGMGQYLEKISGSSWKGYVRGFYSTDLTPEGYCIESATETGSVQLYPKRALKEGIDPKNT